MGGIDLDPASSEIANQIVHAKYYFTKEDDGLKKPWYGNVFMNPPYASELIKQFASKFASHVVDGSISQGIVLVNNATETAWFRELIDCASAVVFTSGRVRFLDPQGNPGAPLQGQAFIYCGPDAIEFLDQFSKFGWGAKL
jgi:phage N-6-adenine-methyltransferase